MPGEVDQSDAVAYSRVCFIPPDGSFHLTERNFVNGSICRTAPRFQMNGVQRNKHSRTTSLSVNTAVTPTGLRPPDNAVITELTGVVSKGVMTPPPGVLHKDGLGQAFLRKTGGKSCGIVSKSQPGGP